MNTKELLDFIVTVIGISGVLFGVYQYRQAQRWKRLEFAANQLQRIYAEPELVLATTFLDYSKRGVPLPESYWEYVGKKVFEHDCKIMYQLMSSRYEEQIEFFIYNDTIDRLFAYLDQIYAFIEMRLIQAKDVESLRWVLDDIDRPTWAEKHGFDSCLLVKRAVDTDHPNVIKLMIIFGYEVERCGKELEVKASPNAKLKKLSNSQSE
jgi:hypothetical protein